jgi:hypothetical protein
MALVLVRYGRMVDLQLVLRCPRCEGSGVDPLVIPDAECKVCKGSKISPDGWAYCDGGLELAVGDVVEVPRTRRSGPGPQLATVVELNADHPSARSTVIRVVERA